MDRSPYGIVTPQRAKPKQRTRVKSPGHAQLLFILCGCMGPHKALLDMGGRAAPARVSQGRRRLPRRQPPLTALLHSPNCAADLSRSCLQVLSRQMSSHTAMTSWAFSDDSGSRSPGCASRPSPEASQLVSGPARMSREPARAASVRAVPARQTQPLCCRAPCALACASVGQRPRTARLLRPPHHPPACGDAMRVVTSS